MKAIVTVGVSASGKTTWAKEFCKKHVYSNVNRDDIRFMMAGVDSWRDYKFRKGFEDMVTEVQRNTIKQLAAVGKNVVVSDTNLNKTHRDSMISFLKSLGYDVELKDFPVALEEAYARDAARKNGVGRDVIYRQYAQWLEYAERAKYSGTPERCNAFIVDVDGTVASMVKRKPYDWHLVSTDSPRKSVIAMVRGLHTEGHKLVFVSGRDSVCREDTSIWLSEHIGPAFDDEWFFMREAGDMRPDTVVKEEIFWECIASHWNVVGAVDDRPCIVRLWHELGIDNVIAVANPYVEF